ncbi:MAG TPA: endonuclease/exonuclease/phosphatase family protein, partial [Verrucomicrobiota bacterium]|nr:endonuclease/exonuclease/phosphatase family protein [Verrucomicrobiota bacterium]
LMAGDFNARPDSRVMQHLLDPSTGWMDTAGAWAAPTSPSESPRSRIDYVLASPRTAWETVQSEVISEAAASDHRPLSVVLRLHK